MGNYGRTLSSTKFKELKRAKFADSIVTLMLPDLLNVHHSPKTTDKEITVGPILHGALRRSFMCTVQICDLQQLFVGFINNCNVCLTLNGPLVSSDSQEEAEREESAVELQTLSALFLVFFFLNCYFN